MAFHPRRRSHLCRNSENMLEICAPYDPFLSATSIFDRQPCVRRFVFSFCTPICSPIYFDRRREVCSEPLWRFFQCIQLLYASMLRSTYVFWGLFSDRAWWDLPTLENRWWWWYCVRNHVIWQVPRYVREVTHGDVRRWTVGKVYYAARCDRLLKWKSMKVWLYNISLEAAVFTNTFSAVLGRSTICRATLL